MPGDVQQSERRVIPVGNLIILQPYVDHHNQADNRKWDETNVEEITKNR